MKLHKYCLVLILYSGLAGIIYPEVFAQNISPQNNGAIQTRENNVIAKSDTDKVNTNQYKADEFDGRQSGDPQNLNLSDQELGNNELQNINNRFGDGDLTNTSVETTEPLGTVVNERHRIHSPLNSQAIDKSAIIKNPVDGLSSLAVSSKYISSGIYPAIKDETAPIGIGERYGDFTQQTRSVIEQLVNTLGLAGLTTKDLVQIRAYVVADNNGQYNDTYLQKSLQFFLSGHKPAISVLGVNELSQPEQLLAVEFSAAYPSGKFLKTKKSVYPLPNTMVKPLTSGYSNTSLGMILAPNASLYVMAGLVADPLNPALDPDDPVYMGNTQQQASSTLQKIQLQLNQLGLSLRDVVYIRSFLAPDATGQTDFDAWEAAYNQAFNTRKNPNKPARTTISVKPGLSTQDRLVEIEVIAVFPDARGVFTYYDVTSPNKMLRAYYSSGRTSRGVAIARHASMHWLSGALPENPKLSMTSQSRNVMKKLEQALFIKDLGWKDVVALRAYLDVKDNFDGNFSAWNAVYDQFFNNPHNPYRPARTTTAVNYLPGGAMIEVELLVIEPE